jgi:hypothetical protein
VTNWPELERLWGEIKAAIEHENATRKALQVAVDATAAARARYALASGALQTLTWHKVREGEYEARDTRLREVADEAWLHRAKDAPYGTIRIDDAFLRFTGRDYTISGRNTLDALMARYGFTIGASHEPRARVRELEAELAELRAEIAKES